MNTLNAFFKGEANRGKERMVFDWNKAAELIRERKPIEASAGLREDWEYTGGIIYKKGVPVTDSYTYLSSTWAVPELKLDGNFFLPVTKCNRKFPIGITTQNGRRVLWIF